MSDDDSLTDQEHLANPAGRLWLFLRSMQQRLLDNPTGGRIDARASVASYFAEVRAEEATYFALIAELMRQPIQARELIGSLDGKNMRRTALLRPLPVVERVIPRAVIPGVALHDVLEGVDTGVMNDLEHASGVLFDHKSLQAVEAEDLKRIKSLASDIIDALADADNLPREIREALRTHASRIIAAADAYRVSGSDGLVDSLDGLIGTAVRASGAPELRHHPVVGRIHALAKLITSLTVIVGAGSAAVLGAGNFFAQLELPPATVVEIPSEQDQHPQI